MGPGWGVPGSSGDSAFAEGAFWGGGAILPSCPAWGQLLCTRGRHSCAAARTGDLVAWTGVSLRPRCRAPPVLSASCVSWDGRPVRPSPPPFGQRRESTLHARGPRPGPRVPLSLRPSPCLWRAGGRPWSQGQLSCSGRTFTSCRGRRCPLLSPRVALVQCVFAGTKSPDSSGVRRARPLLRCHALCPLRVLLDWRGVSSEVGLPSLSSPVMWRLCPRALGVPHHWLRRLPFLRWAVVATRESPSVTASRFSVWPRIRVSTLMHELHPGPGPAWRWSPAGAQRGLPWDVARPPCPAPPQLRAGCQELEGRSRAHRRDPSRTRQREGSWDEEAGPARSWPGQPQRWRGPPGGGCWPGSAWRGHWAGL